MGVFLRWGVFGILAVAALVYAYNASKRLAESRQATQAPVVSPESEPEADDATSTGPEPLPESSGARDPEPGKELPEACEEERRVAERALKFRRDGEPLDRLLRIQVIAFQADPRRRERLEAVARQWFEREGRDPNAATLRAEVLRDCLKPAPAP